MNKRKTIKVLEGIREYLCAGNPVWDAIVVREVITAATEAVKVQNEEDVIKDFFEHGQIEGYSLPELTVFAKACRENGITNDNLSDYIHNIKAAYEYAMDMIMDEFEKSELLHKT